MKKMNMMIGCNNMIWRCRYKDEADVDVKKDVKMKKMKDKRDVDN